LKSDGYFNKCAFVSLQDALDFKDELYMYG
jgi:hypothetical protein